MNGQYIKRKTPEPAQAYVDLFLVVVVVRIESKRIEDIMNGKWKKKKKLKPKNRKKRINDESQIAHRFPRV